MVARFLDSTPVSEFRALQNKMEELGLEVDSGLQKNQELITERNTLFRELQVR